MVSVGTLLSEHRSLGPTVALQAGRIQSRVAHKRGTSIGHADWVALKQAVEDDGGTRPGSRVIKIGPRRPVPRHCTRCWRRGSCKP